MSLFNNKNIVVLTGAGISSESGLKTFRDSNGLWEGHRIEEVATPEAFQRNPHLVHNFYNLRRAQLKEVKPNQAHMSLAEFEKNHVGTFTLITQNVDDLHERAGSKNVLHMHGELRKVRCLETEEIFHWEEELTTKTPHPKDKNKLGFLRPHICWFGEIPFFMDQIEDVLKKADVLLVIGTSGAVYPAAGFVSWVPLHCHRVLINKDEALNHPMFHEVILGSASAEVSKFLTRDHNL